MKSNIFLFLFLSLSIILVGCQESDDKKTALINEDNPKENISVLQLQGSLATYESFEELEKRSDYIIEGKLIDSKFDQVYDPEGNPANERTLSTVEVKKIFKGELKKGEKITVVEPYFMDGDNFVSLEGYNKMDKNGKYILFLYKSTKGNHVLTGVSFGKYDLNKKQKAELKSMVSNYDQVKDTEYFGDETEKFNKFKDKAKNKYGN